MQRLWTEITTLLLSDNRISFQIDFQRTNDCCWFFFVARTVWSNRIADKKNILSNPCSRQTETKHQSVRGCDKDKFWIKLFCSLQFFCLFFFSFCFISFFFIFAFCHPLPRVGMKCYTLTKMRSILPNEFKPHYHWQLLSSTTTTGAQGHFIKVVIHESARI